LPQREGRRFTRAEAKFRLTLGAIWLGAVAVATFGAFVNRPADAALANKAAFYLVLFTIPGVLLAVVLIRRRTILVTTAVLAGAWSARFGWGTMRSSRNVAGFGILLTPMIAFVIVAVACLIDFTLRRRRRRRH
jgi:hypothetical protein